MTAESVKGGTRPVPTQLSAGSSVARTFKTP